MYWRQGDWHFLTQRNPYLEDKNEYIVLIKRGPFRNGHPVLEPDLLGVCMSSGSDDTDKLAMSFVELVELHNFVPPSPYTIAADIHLRGTLAA